MRIIMKHSNKLIISIALLSSSALLNTANAGSVTLVENNGPLQNATALTGFATTGAMMGGMSVGVTFSDSSTTTAFWADTGSTSGGASWLNGGLSLTGDSFSNNWSLKYS